MRKKNFKKTVCTIALAGLCVYAVDAPEEAKASGIPVVDGAHIATSIYNYLAKMDENSAWTGSMGGGIGDVASKSVMTGGLLDNMRGTLDMITAQNQAIAGYQQETDQRNRLREVTKMMETAVLERQMAIANDACKDLSRQGTSGASSAGGSDSARKTKDAVEKLLRSTTSNATNVGNVLKGRTESGFCSQEDISVDGKSINLSNCTAVGPMPGADQSVSSLFEPAEAPGVVRRNATYNNGTGKALAANKDQAFAASTVINNITAALSPLTLEKEVGNDTAAGKDYSAKKVVYNSLVSAAIRPLSVIKGRRDVNAETLAAAGSKKSIWANEKETWMRVFMQEASAFPSFPSDEENVRYEVMRRYADDPKHADSWILNLETKSGDEITKELAKMQAIQLYLSHQNHLRMEENNALLAAILMRDMTGMTKGGMDGLAQQARSSAK